MDTTLTGVIHGRTIELKQDTGLPDGSEVRVMVVSSHRRVGDGVLASIGGWLTDVDDEAEFQHWLAETYRLRESDHRDVQP